MTQGIQQAEKAEKKHVLRNWLKKLKSNVFSADLG